MQHNIAIIVVTHSRADSLHRLLDSISNADYRGYSDISLVISADKHNNDSCLSIANDFIWKFGNKKIIHQEKKLGLKSHILSCGDMVSEFDGVIILEDDLMVSKGFYDYSQQAFEFYQNDEKIAGIGLYSNCYNEVAYCPFDPIEDGFDNYFMQVPCSWGQLWTKRQWNGFKEYLTKTDNLYEQISLPETVTQWSDISSWKKSFYRYLISKDLYFVYPRFGFTTNFAEPGNHIQTPVTVFQTSLQLSRKQMYFSGFCDATAIYDGYYELTSIGFNRFTGKEMDVSFDLNGTKLLSQIKTKYLISSKYSSMPKKYFENKLYPYENNILFDLTTSDKKLSFVLAETVSFTSLLRLERHDADIKKYFISKELIIQKLTTRKKSIFNPLYNLFKKIK